MSVEAKLAGVTCLSLSARGPQRAFLFEPHRLALPCWGLVRGDGPAVLVTFDRHFDLVPPALPPADGLDVLSLDAHARHALDPRNVDHVLAAMEAGLVSHALVVARSQPLGAYTQDVYVDRLGRRHELLRVPNLTTVALDFGRPSAHAHAQRAAQLLAQGPTLLDVDVDCFTTPCDADPLVPLPWPQPVIRDFLHLEEQAFWDAVLRDCRALTVALEPLHCGGVVAGHRLFADAAQVLFRELLGADLP